VNVKFLFLSAAAWVFPGLLVAQLANQPPVPQWLPAGEATVQFEGMERLLKGILFVAGEGEVSVELNGKVVGVF